MRALLVLLFTALACAAEKPLWLACGPAELLKAIEPLAEHRRTEGMDALLLPLAPDAALAAAPRVPDFLVLVGDFDAQAGDAAWQVPTRERPFHGWDVKHPPVFASDFAWAGIDGSGVPRVPTGRIPARTVADATRVVEKILAWEKAAQPALSMPIWAGDPMYSPEFTERFMGFLIAQTQRHAPPWLEPWILSGFTRHPLSGTLDRQAEVFDARTGSGALLTGMIGHGKVGAFLSFKDSAGMRSEYTLQSARSLAAGPPRPPHILIACSCGQFNNPLSRSLAEELVLAPAGPVLCVAATEESHPLPNFYTATAMLEQMRATAATARFGPMWLAAQRAARRRNSPLYELILRDSEGRLKRGHSDVELLQSDQPALYAILGDPATRVPLPKPLNVAITQDGARWKWEVARPAGAIRLRVERRAFPGEFPLFPTASDAERAPVFAKANASLAFAPVATLDAAALWSGEFTEPGIVRFVVETSGGIHAFGAELR